ncbi:MarR family winged helix-turn-helix transcriptional regulator [Lentzea sp. JNUCC 0626]|uniref:MarR family winged helix-turn-helix transcriptional regulator n=1 Tax=Lentzea sp. JNUCC 0626 TaxID=3367513 RepID=UPI00374990A1
MRAWTRLAAVSVLLISELDGRLVRSAGLSHVEYLALTQLADAPERTLTMSELAARTNSTPSRLSHLVSRLERRELAVRHRSPDSGRVVLTTLTALGWERVAQATPEHLRAVRELVFSAIEPEEVDQFGDVLGRLLDRLDPGGALTFRDRAWTSDWDGEPSTPPPSGQVN